MPTETAVLEEPAANNGENRRTFFSSSPSRIAPEIDTTFDEPSPRRDSVRSMRSQSISEVDGEILPPAPGLLAPGYTSGEGVLNVADGPQRTDSGGSLESFCVSPGSGSRRNSNFSNNGKGRRRSHMPSFVMNVKAHLTSPFGSKETIFSTNESMSKKLESTKVRASTMAKCRHIIRRYTNLTFAFALLGIVLMIIEVEVNHSQDNKETVVTDILKGVISLTTILLLHSIYRIYLARYDQQKVQGLVLDNEPFFVTRFARMCLLECTLCCLHVPPFVHGTFTVNSPDNVREDVYPIDNFGAVMFCRLYLLGRMLKTGTALFRNGANVIDTLEAVKVDTFFAVKTWLFFNPFRLLGMMLGTNIIVSSYILMICERVAQPYFEHFTNSLWTVFITVTTVGYGDEVPITSFGRLIVSFATLNGMMVSGFLISVLGQKLSLANSEVRVINMLRQQSRKKQLLDAAARTIQTAWHYHLCKKLRLGRSRVLAAKYNLHRAVLRWVDQKVFKLRDQARDATLGMQVQQVGFDLQNLTGFVKELQEGQRSLERKLERATRMTERQKSLESGYTKMQDQLDTLSSKVDAVLNHVSHLKKD